MRYLLLLFLASCAAHRPVIDSKPCTFMGYELDDNHRPIRAFYMCPVNPDSLVVP